MVGAHFCVSSMSVADLNKSPWLKYSNSKPQPGYLLDLGDAGGVKRHVGDGDLVVGGGGAGLLLTTTGLLGSLFLLGGTDTAQISNY